MLLQGSDWSGIKELVGVLRPVFDVSCGVQASGQTIAEAFSLVCKLRWMMHAPVIADTSEFDQTLAVGEKDILAHLAADGGQTDPAEIDDNLYKFSDVPVRASREDSGRGAAAPTYVSLVRAESDKRLFNSANISKNRLKNETVQMASIVSPVCAALLRKVGGWVGQHNPPVSAKMLSCASVLVWLIR